MKKSFVTIDELLNYEFKTVLDFPIANVKKSEEYLKQNAEGAEGIISYQSFHVSVCILFDLQRYITINLPKFDSKTFASFEAAVMEKNADVQS